MGWVTAMPSAREYQLTNDQWRDAVSNRLHLPLSFLVAGPTHCDCHDAFDRRSGDIAQGVVGTTHRPTLQGAPQQRRPRIRRPPVDPHGEHDQRCGFAVSLRRHDIVQSVLEKKIRRAGKAVRLATVHELRFGVADPSQDNVGEKWACRLPSLEPGKKYVVRVRGLNAKGARPACPAQPSRRWG